MPYIDTYYDYDIHRECFRVSESASYTHTTDVLLNNTEIVSEVINYFTATFTFDVLRNIGDSNVAIYDNGTLLELIEFNQNAVETEIELELSYGVEHNIEARYLGNNQCLPSQSRIISIYEEIKEEFITNLTFVGAVDGKLINYSQSDDDIIYMELKDNLNQPIRNASIDVYIEPNSDDVSIVTVQTNNNGLAQLSAPTQWTSDNGIHRFKARYNTTENHFGVEAELVYYIGLDVTMTPRYAHHFTSTIPYFDIQIMDYEGNPMAGRDITLFAGVDDPISTGYTDANGKISLQGIAEATHFWIGDLQDALLAEVDITRTSDYSLSAVYDSIAIEGNRLPITFMLNANGEVGGYPIEVTSPLNQIAVTDQNGRAIVYYETEGTGTKYVRVNGGHLNHSHSFEDLVAYWGIESNVEEIIPISQGFSKLNNYYLLKSVSDKYDVGTKSYVGIGDGNSFVGDFELTFKVMHPSSSIALKIGFYKSNTFYNADIRGTYSFNTGDIVKATRIDDNLIVYKNNDWLYSELVPTDAYPMIFLIKRKYGEEEALRFNQLRLKRVE